MTDALQSAIETAWDNRDSVTAETTGEVREAVETAIGMLDAGEARVAERAGNGANSNKDWQVNQWLKKAVLLSFRLNDNRVMEGGSAGHP